MKLNELTLDYTGCNAGLVNLIYVGYIPEGKYVLDVDYRHVNPDEVQTVTVTGRLLYIDYMYQVNEKNDPTFGYEYTIGDRQYHPSVTDEEKRYYALTGYGRSSIETHVGAYP